MRQRDETTGRYPAETELHAIDFLFPNRPAEPDLESLDLESAPFRCKEMAEFMDEDDHIENGDHDSDPEEYL